MIVVEAMAVQAGEFRLDDVCLRVPTGGYAVLMGKTGSGKTTILETVIGLRSVTRGRIWLHDREVTHLKPAVRGIGYVPQDGALFSKMTVEEQLGLALVIRRVPAAAIRQRVRELAELLGIAHLLHRKPRGLSGGERQRVALGRALSFRPRILCLDEPLSALDDETRRQMCDLLASIRAKTGVTTLHITHNLAEAQILADCLFRLENGRIETIELAGAEAHEPGKSERTPCRRDRSDPSDDPSDESAPPLLPRLEAVDFACLNQLGVGLAAGVLDGVQLLDRLGEFLLDRFLD